MSIKFAALGTNALWQGWPMACKKCPSIIARGFFDVLWRWNRLSCEASQKRPYTKILSNSLRHQGTQTKRRTSTPLVQLAASQRRSQFVSSLFYPGTSMRSIKAGDRPDEGPPVALPVASYSIDKPDAHSSFVVREDPQSERPKQLDVPPISQKLRGIMRNLPASVVVVTATTTHSYPKPDEKDPTCYQVRQRTARGMALSSFTTLTLSPEPIVTFNVRYPSSTLEAIQSTKQFLVHILDASHAGARISNIFTNGNLGKGGKNQSAFANGVQSGLFTLESEVGPDTGRNDKFQTLPMLRGKGIGSVLRCEILSSQPGTVTIPSHSASKEAWRAPKVPGGLMAVGDHMLVLARVVEILDRSQNDIQNEPNYGLSYVNGQYRYVGTSVSLENTSRKGKWT